MTMMKASTLLWLLLATTSSTTTTVAQFACTLTANDEGSCLGTTADDGKHCVWCAVSSLGFCVSEAQAESMESNIPGIECDRYSGNDDDDDSTPSEDDDVTPSEDDDEATTDDQAPSPNDDALPPDYWKCLKKKDSQSCLAAECTWCDNKGGFGLCLTGPSADMASKSDWFTCKKPQEVEDEGATVGDPYDTSCITAYMEDPTQEGCISTQDEDGATCLWCSLAGMTDLCLSQEQADMASQLGVTCEQAGKSLLRGQPPVDDPYDTSCLMAYLQDPTAEGCTSALDADGQACEFCTFQDSIDLCLTEEQGQYLEQLGAECDSDSVALDEEEEEAQDPYDPSCAIAFMQDQSEETCKAAVDSDGNPCEYCTLQESLNMCLNQEQAQYLEQLGGECDSDSFVQDKEEAQNPYDQSCAIAYFQDQSEQTCKAAVDSDGNPCEYCALQGGMKFCLNAEQAEAVELFGAECDSRAVALGAEDKVTFPSDFWECLENYEENGCGTNSCTWCNTEVGVGFCVADSVADAMRECNFFDCNYKLPQEPVKKTTNPFDPACLQGMESHEICRTTLDSEGEACVWCDRAGVFGLCLSAAGADAAGEYLTCDEVSAIA